jgi:hypothetical protein
MARNRSVGVGLALLGLVVVGCSSSKSNNTALGSSSSTTATTAAPTGGTGGTGGSGGSGSSGANDLTALQTSVKSLKNATFKASYTGTGSDGKQTTITFEQKPPKFAFLINGQGLMLDNGTTSYFCSTNSGTPSCISYGGSGNPLAGLLGLYNGTTLLPLLQEWQSQVEAKLAGANVTFSSQTFAGQAAKCVNWSYQGQSAKWCVTDAGLAAYYGGSGSGGSGSFSLTGFSTSVNDADFSLPAGATTITIPAGISIPSIP